MKMSELILAVGDEHVVFQNLFNDAHQIDKTKDGTRITFYTDAVSAEDVLFGKPKKIGLVIWLPKDRVDAALASAKEVNK